MTHQNLVLTEQAIRRHTKRLQKEFKQINHDLKLSDAQNMISRIFGMKNYHELKNILKFKNKDNSSPEDISNILTELNTIFKENQKEDEFPHYSNNNFLYEKLIQDSKTLSKINDLFLKACKDGDLQLVKLLFEDDNLLNKPNLESKDFHGNTYGAIYQACWSGNLDLVKYLIENKNITVKNEPFMFFYCRHFSVFKYMLDYLDVSNQTEAFIKKLKETLLNSPFYDYASFKEILNIEKLNLDEEDYSRLLFNIVNPYSYDTKKECDDKHEIIRHLISLNADLYDTNDIFRNLMDSFTRLELSKNFPNDYITIKLSAIKDILNYLNKNYDYFNTYNIKELIAYFKQNPDSLNNEWSSFNNSYIKSLIASNE